MITSKDMAWCPGCGDFLIRSSLETALQSLGIPAQQTVLVSGIGQAAKIPQYIQTNYFNGLHGRSLPVAVGVKLARPELTVVAVSGEGCMYGEGGNHFIHTIRKNLDMTIMVCDNKIYGLTKGQSSPTTEQGVVNALSPEGNHNAPLRPLAIAVALGATFVARGFSGDKEHLIKLIMAAVLHKGTAVIDILQPCVSFNKINTQAWYKERVYKINEPLTDRSTAITLAQQWGDQIPIGVLYQTLAPVYTPAVVFKNNVTSDALHGLLRTYHK